MKVTLKKCQEISTAINIIALFFFLLMLMVCVGGTFFEYAGKAFHYIYFFIFKRKFNFLTIVLILVGLGMMSLFGFFTYKLAQKEKLKLSDILPMISILAPIFVLMVIRGSQVNAFKEVHTFPLVLMIISLILYFMTSVLIVVFKFQEIFAEKKKTINTSFEKKIVPNVFTKRYWFSSVDELIEHIDEVEILNTYFYQIEKYDELESWLSTNDNEKLDLMLGLSYFFGHGVMLDFDKAFTYLTRAAKLGNLDAKKRLIECYELGLGVNKNLSSAHEIKSELF